WGDPSGFESRLSHISRPGAEETDLKVELKELEGWKRSLDVEVPAEDVSRHFDELVEEYRRRVSIPGFRTGHVPASLVRQNMGAARDEEFLRRVVPDAYEKAVQQAAVVPASQAQIENLKYRQGEPLRFTAVFEARPDLAPKDYQDLELKQEVDE